MTARLGAVGFLNARPLVDSLESNPAFEVSFSVPSVCADQLRCHQVDVGLIPAIEYARSSDPYHLLPHLAIVSKGEVLTVRLFCTRPVAEIRKVALDTSSLTSVALVRILLVEKFGVEPEFIEAPPNLNAMLDQADAALLIGDSVFRVLESEVESVDLGRAWTEHTGLPFVYAFWAGRAGALSVAEAAALVSAGRAGRKRIPQIARQFAEQTGPATEAETQLYERYLREHICFDLAAEELAGLRRFYELAHAHHLIEAIPELRFFEVGEV